MDIETFLSEAREKIRFQPWEKNEEGWRRRLNLKDAFSPLPDKNLLADALIQSGKNSFFAIFDVLDYDKEARSLVIFQNFPRPGGVWESTDETCEDCGADLEVEITVSEKGIEHEGRLRCPTGCLPK